MVATWFHAAGIHAVEQVLEALVFGVATWCSYPENVGGAGALACGLWSGFATLVQ